jgi:hypothetical protein
MTYQAIGGHFVCLGTGKQGKGSTIMKKSR